MIYDLGGRHRSSTFRTRRQVFDLCQLFIASFMMVDCYEEVFMCYTSPAAESCSNRSVICPKCNHLCRYAGQMDTCIKFSMILTGIKLFMVCYITNSIRLCNVNQLLQD